MLHVNGNRRAGMTLVELLVVVAILATLAGTALPMLTGASESRRSREATRMITTHIAQSQARALGRTEPAGFLLVPPASNKSASFAIDLSIAEVPPVFRGDAIPSTVSGELSGGLFTLTAPGSLAGVALSPSAGDLVRFDGRGPWYSIVSATKVALLATANHTADNTPWPSSGDHTFEILRQPVQTGSALTLQDSRCIDLFWSGCGGSNPTTYNANTFGSSPGSIAILFNAVGRPIEIYRAAGSQRITPQGPIFLLVGRSDRAGQVYDPAVTNQVTGDDSRGANWQYPDSYWIAINPSNGLARSAECVRGELSAFASQGFVRQVLFADGR